MDKKKGLNFCIEELGFYRVSVSSPKISLADIDENLNLHLQEIKKAEKDGANLILFPQLSITGASLGSVFKQSLLIEKAFDAVRLIAEKTKQFSILSVVGLPFLYSNKLYSCSAVIGSGRLIALVPHLPSEFLSPHFYDFEDEPCLVPFCGENIPFGKDFKFIVSHKDSYNLGKGFSFSFDASSYSDLILAPLAEPSKPLGASAMRQGYKAFSAAKKSALAFVNCGIGESVSDYIFAGECGIFENGKELRFTQGLKDPLLKKLSLTSKEEPYISSDIDMEFLKGQKLGLKFSKKPASDWEILIEKEKLNTKKTLDYYVQKNPFLPYCDDLHKNFIYKNFFSELIFFQGSALASRLQFIGCSKCVVGISGGLDSSLALLASAYSLKLLNIDLKNLYAVTMPGFGTTEKTKNNASALAEILGCTLLEIPIGKAMVQHFSDIGQDMDNHDIAYENAQARERTQILMDKANQIGGIMVGSGDLSEAALGWMTYGGDQMSMYEVNSSIPKTLLKDCILAFAENKIFFEDEKKNAAFFELLSNIINTPVSPELLPPKNGEISQKTEDIIGPYQLHDFFIYHAIGNGFSPKKVYFLALETFKDDAYSETEILKWLNIFYKRFFSQQFKRSCSPEGASVTGFSLSPRGAWLMPSEISVKIWQKELEFLVKIM
ncbi:NAD(+) synthase [Treponema sp. OMZ 792]|uniref:NAD(+) synthase n=1 Tax=unclassified Treponema TaxID=2638727 RepID=UPI0020A235E6|nr:MULTISPECIES: NAD(+) synthase [unclassified Treponema]UTC76319.1 NAD(+) synthase [Treponema sp. OMZ 792]UTC80318.1 NAD(+) synthase [Treponema sp. OMZ 798]